MNIEKKIIELVHNIGPDVQSLIDRKEIGEEFHPECEYKFVARVDDKLVGIIAYRKGSIGETELPQFCHVIISPEFRGKDEARMLLKDSEDQLKSMGYPSSYCYILNDKKYMHRSAVKHGYVPFEKDSEGTFYYKNL